MYIDDEQNNERGGHGKFFLSLCLLNKLTYI